MESYDCRKDLEDWHGLWTGPKKAREKIGKKWGKHGVWTFGPGYLNRMRRQEPLLK